MAKEKRVKSLPGYRVLQPGEMIQEGDYMQIGESYSLVCSAGCICDTVGTVVNDAWENRIWTDRK